MAIQLNAVGSMLAPLANLVACNTSSCAKLCGASEADAVKPDQQV